MASSSILCSRSHITCLTFVKDFLNDWVDNWRPFYEFFYHFHEQLPPITCTLPFTKIIETLIIPRLPFLCLIAIDASYSIFLFARAIPHDFLFPQFPHDLIREFDRHFEWSKVYEQ